MERVNWGLFAAAVFGILVLGASVYLVLNGHERTGTITLLTTLSASPAAK